MNYSNIPDKMKAFRNWILWRLEDRGREKPVKVPYSVNGGKAKTNDPSTWATFDEALAALQRGGYNGLGFVFEGTPFVGVDVDGCFNPETGEFSAEALEVVQKEKERFISDYLTIANEGGVVATDQKTEYVPITTNPAIIDDKQIAAIKTKIYDYLGLSEKIVNSSYTEDEWAAFYESTIEPIAVQMSLEFTRKIFTDREQAFGNSILFESGRLQFSSNATKVNLIAQLMPYGLLTINQALEILNLPGVEDGDKRLQTLNMVAADKANRYQFKEGKS